MSNCYGDFCMEDLLTASSRCCETFQVVSHKNSCSTKPQEILKDTQKLCRNLNVFAQVLLLCGGYIVSHDRALPSLLSLGLSSVVWVSVSHTL